MDIFEGVESQYIDVYGKCRILNYETISIVISPIPPLDVKQVPKEDMITASSLTVSDFIKKTKDIKVLEQDGDRNQKTIQGVWIEHPYFYFAYIPIEIKDRNMFESVDFTDPTLENPIYTEEESELENMKRNKITAFYLKEYSLIEYAKKSSLSINDFEIVKDHNYNIHNIPNIIGMHSNIYKNNKLVVHDEETSKRLIYYVNTRIYNNPSLKDKYKKIKVIDIKKEFAPDQFKTETSELIFSNKKYLYEWIKSLDTNFEINQGVNRNI